MNTTAHPAVSCLDLIHQEQTAFMASLILETRNKAAGPFYRAPREEGDLVALTSQPFVVVMVGTLPHFESAQVIGTYQHLTPDRGGMSFHTMGSRVICLDARGAQDRRVWADNCAKNPELLKAWGTCIAQVWARDTLTKWDAKTKDWCARLQAAMGDANRRLGERDV